MPRGKIKVTNDEIEVVTIMKGEESVDIFTLDEIIEFAQKYLEKKRR